MANGISKANFDSLRTLAFGGISGSYAAVGTPATKRIRGFCITNTTEGDMIFSTDNTISAGMLFVAKGSYKLYDIQSNMNAQFDDAFVLPIGTQFYVKQVTAPVSGAIYIEVLY